MVAKKLNLGFALVDVRVNGESVHFQVEENKHDAYWLEDGTEMHPAGSALIFIDTISYQLGDRIVVEFDSGVFESDGGGERQQNIVGEIGEFTVGMGAPCTEDYEEAFAESRYDEWPIDMNLTRRALPYELQGCCNRGFEFWIVDNPSEYNDRLYRRNIIITIVWEYTSRKNAWSIVSTLTS